MEKKVKAINKLQIPAGQANPAPPVGPALGQHGLNIMGFCKDYNDRTASQTGSIVPVEITVYEDRTFTFITKTPPTSDLIKKALGVDKASGQTGHETAGTISTEKLREMSKLKTRDLNAHSIEAEELIIKGNGRSMGIQVG